MGGCKGIRMNGQGEINNSKTRRDGGLSTNGWKANKCSGIDRREWKRRKGGRENWGYWLPYSSIDLAKMENGQKIERAVGGITFGWWEGGKVFGGMTKKWSQKMEGSGPIFIFSEATELRGWKKLKGMERKGGGDWWKSEADKSFHFPFPSGNLLFVQSLLLTFYINFWWWFIFLYSSRTVIF